MNSYQFDVAIIGGGPSGSTAAAILAEQGISTAVVEQAKFPRFHIGESLLPANRPIFERLGVLDLVEAMAVHKPGGKWIYGNRPVYGEFAYCGKNASFADNPYAYMVHRSEFDQLLLDNAVDRGAQLFDKSKVLDVLENASGRISGIKAKSDDGKDFVINSRLTLDCSGQRSFIATRLKTRQPNHLNRMSVFGHFNADIKDKELNNGWFVGQLIHDGWIWLIPLPDGTVSIGAVVDASEYKKSKLDANQYLTRMASSTPALKQAFGRLELIGDAKTTGAMGYTNPDFVGDGWLLVGDAAFFIDPCYSSGVYMAMYSAEKAADTVTEALSHSDHPCATQFAAYDHDLKHHERCVLELVDGFYTATRSRTLTWLIPRIPRWLYLRNFTTFIGGDFSKFNRFTSFSLKFSKQLSKVCP